MDDRQFEVIYALLEAQRVLLEEIAIHLKNPPVVMVPNSGLWQCGCGHINGPNLYECALCRRKPTMT